MHLVLPFFYAYGSYRLAMSTPFKRDDYFNTGKWAQPTLPGVVWCYWSATESVKQSSQGHTFHPMLILDGNFPVRKGDGEEMARLIQEVAGDKEATQYNELLDNVGREYERQHLAVLKELDSDHETFLPKLFDTYREMVGFWTFTLLFGDYMNDYFLSEKIASSPEDMLEKLSVVARRTWLEDQAREVRDLAGELLKNDADVEPSDVTDKLIAAFSDLSAKIDKHVEKFKWFGTHHWMGEGYDRKKCLDGISGALKRVGHKKSENDAHVRVDGLGPLWRLLATVTYWRTHCAEVTSKVVFESRPQLMKCAERWGTTYDQLIYTSPREILERLLQEKSDFSFPVNYQERKDAYGCYLDEAGDEHIVTGHELKGLLDEMIAVSQADVSEFTGMVASKGGPVTSKVTVLIEPKDFDKFDEGDILVAPETTPDFVPYMKKAVAVVTDRGGITSHAAIVSRELGIPCIIGTGIATQVLKNGAKVTVDTDKGTVTILNNEE